jgi:signal transduction histidine kinase/ActR/RegA family two-component response regulator
MIATQRRPEVPTPQEDVRLPPRAPHRAAVARVVRVGWRLLLGASAGMFLHAGFAAATPAIALQTLTRATFVPSDAPAPPAATGAAITLPDRWDNRAPDLSGHAWYLIDWPLAAAQGELQGIYLTAVLLPAEVYVNGTLVGATGALTGRPPRTWEHGQLFEVPASLLHAGGNRIALHVYRKPTWYGGIGPVVAGPHANARALWFRDLVVHAVGPAIVSITVIVVGLSIAVLWLRRHDPLYLLFGFAATLWGLHTAVSLLPERLLPLPHWTIWWHAVYILFAMLLCKFCVRFAEFEWVTYRRFALAYAAAVVPVLYAAEFAGVLGPTAMWVRLGAIALVAVALWAVARYAFRIRNVESVLLLAAGAVSLAFGVHDWLAARDPLALRPVWLVPYAALAFLVLVGWILTDRFVRALNEFERLNVDLEARIREKSASLEFQLAQTQQAKEDAEAANRAKSRFLAAASHDLRQPLHALGLFAGALPGHTRDAIGDDLVQRVRTSVASLASLLSALLDISKLDAGAIVAAPKSLRLDEIFERLANDFLPEALEKRLRFAVVPTRLVVRSDPALLERILRNLVANALRYTSRGGVVVGARRRGGSVAIEVWDSGPGIPAAESRRIFEEFYQVGKQERDRTRGLGLGLAIVRRLAELLGHRVELASRPGKGSVFRVVVSAGDAQAVVDAPASAPAAFDALAGHAIVVIEDEAAVRDSTRILLASWGCTVVAAADADEALARLDGATPSALIVDYRLRGGQDGLGAIARMHAALGRGVPAVLVSGESSTAELARIKESGFLLLHKPLSPAKLRSTLAFLLGTVVAKPDPAPAVASPTVP